MSTIILTSGAGYSEPTGSWGGAPGARFINAAGTAAFAFTGLTPGTPYALALSWLEFANRVTNAAWSVSGTSGSPSGTIDMQAAPASFASGGNNYQYFNQAFVPTGTTLTLTIAYPASPSPPGNYVETQGAFLDLISNVNPIPTVAAGDWNTGANWLFGSVPTGAAFATLKHAMTVTADTTIGDGTASTVLACTSPAGSLAIVGAKLTIRGENALFGVTNSGVVKVYLDITNNGATPGIVELDGNSGVTPTISFDHDSMLRIVGVPGTECIIRTKSGSAGQNGLITSAVGSDRSLFVDAQHATFLRLGDATHAGLAALATSWWAAGPGGYPRPTFRFDHCTFDACGRIPYVLLGATGQVDFDLIFTDNTYTNSVSGDYLCQFIVSAGCPIGAGTRLIDGNLFLGLPAAFSVPTDFTITSNYFDDNLACAGGTSPLWAVFDGNFVRNQRGSTEHLWGGGGTDNFCLYNPTITDSSGTHFLLIPQGGSTTFDGNIFQSIGSSAADHSCIGETEADIGVRTCTAIRNLMLPGFGRLLATNSTDTGRTNVAGAHRTVCDHNTGIVDGTTSLVDCGAQDVHTIDSLRSNLASRPSASTGIYLFNNNDAAPVDDVFVFSGGFPLADYNGRFNLNTVTSGDASNGTPYSTGLTAAPGTHDVTADPRFFDDSRDLLSWAQSEQGADGTLAGALAVVQADLSLVASSLIPWVRAGFAPTNAAYQDAGHDGVTIGAVELATPTPTPIATGAAALLAM